MLCPDFDKEEGVQLLETESMHAFEYAVTAVTESCGVRKGLASVENQTKSFRIDEIRKNKRRGSRPALEAMYEELLKLHPVINSVRGTKQPLMDTMKMQQQCVFEFLILGPFHQSAEHFV